MTRRAARRWRAARRRFEGFPQIDDLLTLRPLAEIGAAEVDALLDLAFGVDRHGRTAYRLREGMVALPAFSFALTDGNERLVASVQTWPVALRGDDGRTVPLLLLGPIAVRPDAQSRGLGRRVTQAALRAIDAAGEPATVLIGDPEYYGRFFGFAADATAGWRVPGPVERRRLLARVTGDVDLPAGGMLGPRHGR